ERSWSDILGLSGPGSLWDILGLGSFGSLGFGPGMAPLPIAGAGEAAGRASEHKPISTSKLGPPVVDPEVLKRLEEFNRSYDELIDSYARDANFQEQLAKAYAQGADAVAKLRDAHAADLAVER